MEHIKWELVTVGTSKKNDGGRSRFLGEKEKEEKWVV